MGIIGLRENQQRGAPLYITRVVVYFRYNETPLLRHY